VGDLLLQEMMSLREEFEIVGDVRGSGLMLGMELVKSKVSQVSSQLTCSGLPQNFLRGPVYFVCLKEARARARAGTGAMARWTDRRSWNAGAVLDHAACSNETLIPTLTTALFLIGYLCALFVNSHT